MIMMINCFCSMVGRTKGVSLISSRNHCQRSTPLRISNMTRAGFESAQNLSQNFVERSCALVITTSPWRHLDLRIKCLSYKVLKEFLKNVQLLPKIYFLKYAIKAPCLLGKWIQHMHNNIISLHSCTKSQSYIYLEFVFLPEKCKQDKGSIPYYLR